MSSLGLICKALLLLGGLPGTGLSHLESSNPWVRNGERVPHSFTQEVLPSLIEMLFPCFGLKLSYLTHTDWKPWQLNACD